jgi:hypothetical protein
MSSHTLIEPQLVEFKLEAVTKFRLLKTLTKWQSKALVIFSLREYGIPNEN